MLSVLASPRTSVRLLLVSAAVALLAVWSNHQTLAANAARDAEILAQTPGLGLCGFANVGPRGYARLLSVLALVAGALAVTLARGNRRQYSQTLAFAAVAFAWPGIAGGWPPVDFGELEPWYLGMAMVLAAASLATVCRPALSRRVPR